MAFVKAHQRAEKPGWVDLSAWGLFSVPADAAPTDLHFHDCDEYWFITAGKALVRCGDEEQEMEPGDLLCARMGELHQTVKVLSQEPFCGVYVEGPLRGKKRRGHLHPGKDAFPTPEEIDGIASGDASP